MDAILPTDEYKEVDGRAYANPEVSLNEANQFIDNLRGIQKQQNQEIAEQTYNLGTDIESVQGGLGTNTPGGLAYFTSRYQTPQTNSVVADLRSVAQAAALNEVLAAEQEIAQKKYQDAYRRYQRRQYDRAYGGGGSGTGSTGNTGNTNKTITGGVNEKSTGANKQEASEALIAVRNRNPGTTVSFVGTTSPDGSPIVQVTDNETGAQWLEYPDGSKKVLKEGRQSTGGGGGGGW